jgi:hypothetical protein
MIKRYYFYTCFLFSLFPCLVWAKLPNDYVSISFQTISWGGVVKDVFFTSADGEARIFSPNASFSKTQHYVGPNRLTFYTKQNTTEGFTKIPVAFADFPVNAEGHYIFVFIKDQQTEFERFRIYPIAFDSKMGKPNQVTLVNLSSNKMIGRIDDVKFELDAGSLRTVNVHPNSGGNVLAQFLLETEHGWKPLYSNNWRVYEGKQVFAFISRRNEKSRKVNVRLIIQNNAHVD